MEEWETQPSYTPLTIRIESKLMKVANQGQRSRALDLVEELLHTHVLLGQPDN